jgi:tetratricopeptide (TPR) repeat protein
MSISSSERSDRIAARLTRAAGPRNGYPAGAPELAPGVPEGRPRAVPDLPQELPDDREWDERMAREVRHQEVIEASFDRAEAYARLGDFDRAVEWLDRAATVSGGLPPAYRAQRARWVRTTAVRPRQTGGYRETRLAQAGAGAGR